MPKTHRVLLLPTIALEQLQPLVHPKLQVVVIWKHPPLTTSWPAGHTHVLSACWTNLAGQADGQVQVPVWHERGLVQLPQSSVPPQPSVIVPQFLPWAVHVVLTQHWSLASQTFVLAGQQPLSGQMTPEGQTQLPLWQL